MKTITLAICLMFTANAFALSVEDCQRLAVFKEQQDRKLALARYGHGMISAAQLTQIQNELSDKRKAEQNQCSVPGEGK